MNKNETKKRAKENKKKLKEIEKIQTEDNYDINKFIKILAIVVCALVAFYLIFAFFHGELFHKKEKEEETIQNIEILAGTSFNKQDGEYYVLYYDFKGDNKTLCDSIYNVYSNNSSNLKMFKVNLGSNLNSNYVALSEAEVNTESNETLKVMDATLIKFSDGKAIDVISGKTALVDYEDTLLK